jgi:phytanoyl-CoA hydroxylase
MNLINKKVRIVIQSMTITKQPSIGAPVFSHCDSTFLYTSPPSAVGLWFALERCTSSNGCLSFLPGSHKTNSIPERLVRVEGGAKGTKIIKNIESEIGGKQDWDSEEGWVVEECEVSQPFILSI